MVSARTGMDKKRNRLEEVQMLALKLCFLVLGIFVGYLFLHGFAVYGDSEFFLKYVNRTSTILLLFSIFVFVLIIVNTVKYLLNKLSSKNVTIFMLLVVVLMIVGQLYVVFYHNSLYLWDGAFVVGSSISLADGNGIPSSAEYYLSIYPNQHPFVVLTMCFVWIAKCFQLEVSQMSILLNLINTVGLFISVFGFLKFFQNKKDKAFVLFLLAINPFLYVNTTYYYTMTLSIPFMIWGIYFALKILGEGNTSLRIIDMFGFVFCFCIGGMIRVTTLIPMIAVVIYSFFVREYKKMGVVIVGAMLTLVLISFGGRACSKVINIDTANTKFPMTHWVMMSLTSPGNHNAEDEAYTASFQTYEEKKEAVMLRLKEKISDLGLIGYMKLLKYKLDYTFGSGTRSYVFSVGNSLRTKGLYVYLYGEKRDGFVLYSQVYYLLLLFGGLIAIKRGLFSNDKTKGFVIIGGLTVLGGILFYFLWETSPWYSIPFVLPLTMLTGDGLCVQRKEQNGKWNCRVVLLMLSILSFAYCAFFFVSNCALFTEMAIDRTNTVSNQLLANTEFELGDGEVLKQEMVADSAFNQIIFQHRNFVGEENTSIYSVKLVEIYGQGKSKENRKEKIIFKDQIVANDQPRNGAYIRGVDNISNFPGYYELVIEKIGGKPEHNMSFICYEMGGYDPYPRGGLFVNNEKQQMDMLFALYQKSHKAYTNKTAYLCFVGILFLIFLFLQFCCILIGCMEKRKWNLC